MVDDDRRKLRYQEIQRNAGFRRKTLRIFTKTSLNMRRLTIRFKPSLKSLARKPLAVLEEVVLCSRSYAYSMENVRPLLEWMEEKVEVIKDVSSRPDVMNKQDETAKELLKKKKGNANRSLNSLSPVANRWLSTVRQTWAQLRTKSTRYKNDGMLYL